MSIKVNDPAMSHLPDEKSVTLGHKGDRIHLHTWKEGDRIHPNGSYSVHRNDSSVFVALGDVSKSGLARSGDHVTSVFDRADFVEAILAVFPELVRR